MPDAMFIHARTPPDAHGRACACASLSGEQGHAFGMPHAGGAYDDGKYPYENGGLKGSAWAYDVTTNNMIDIINTIASIINIIAKANWLNSCLQLSRKFI